MAIVETNIQYIIETINNCMQTLTTQKSFFEKLLVVEENSKQEPRPDNWNYKIGEETILDVFTRNPDELKELYGKTEDTEVKQEIKNFLMQMVKLKNG